MGQKNKRNQKRRLNSLILLVAFTAIMLIVSTYAWFSINKEVSITNLTGTVNVVEGLQISLNAKDWSDSIDLSTKNLKTDGWNGNSNFVPTELLPVSTTGVAGSNAKELIMYRGVNTEKTKLSSIIATDLSLTAEDDAINNRAKYPGYYAFDVFLMNSTDKSITSNEVLQLNSNSSLVLKDAAEANNLSGKESSGLQNTVRVGFAKFSKVHTDMGAADTDILKSTNATDSYISDVAIWEPNANAHIVNIVNNNNSIKLDGQTDYTFAADTVVPTYALTATAAVAGSDPENPTNNIADIYDWKASPTNNKDAGKLAIQNTLQTNATVNSLNAVYNLKSTSNGTSNFTIQPNAITKIRIYVWLEGQDVDCTNYASHGGGIDLDIGFAKGEAPAN